MPPFTINAQAGAYPIVYVRGFAGSSGSREDAFYDAYYGFAETSVEKRQVLPRRPEAPNEPWYVEPDVFEGQLIRFIKEEGYVDAANGGVDLCLRNQVGNPTQSLWVSRFYDVDVVQGRARDILDHARELKELICSRIPANLKALRDEQGNPMVDLGPGDRDYKVILIAHSMGGLVCRCLLQNILPGAGEDPQRWIHRLVTIASPHGGIEAGAIPGFLEELVMGQANIAGTAIFREGRMRDYLCIPKAEKDVRSLKSTKTGGKPAFPPEKCLCLIGSDHESYAVASGLARGVIGSHSDGLVKQDRAFIPGAYTANVHRSHSGRRGIVNSFESYQNIRRFLFGDTRFTLTLRDPKVLTARPTGGIKEFYDLEFGLSIRGTNVVLHQRRQKPCENALRYERGPNGLKQHDGGPVREIHLHTGFMSTQLRRRDSPRFSHFALSLRVDQHRVREGWLWDQDYPERPIFSETLEVRVGNADPTAPDEVQYRWLVETVDPASDQNWKVITPDAKGELLIPLRPSATFSGTLCIAPTAWDPGH